MAEKWPGPDDRCVVNEMLRDPSSPHWESCYVFIRRLVDMAGADLPLDLKEDVVQKAMLSVTHYLPSFRFNSQLRTWLVSIVHHRVADERRLNRQDQRYRSITSSDPLLTDEDEDKPEIGTYVPIARAAEEECLIEETLREVTAEISKYINSHAHPERNRRLVEMVLFNGRTLEEAARATGTSPAVASYSIRSVRRYLQEKFRGKPQR